MREGQNQGIGSKSPSISIRDDGDGMSPETVRKIWLVIAHDHKEKQLQEKKRTGKGRLPLGSKGLVGFPSTSWAIRSPWLRELPVNKRSWSGLTGMP